MCLAVMMALLWLGLVFGAFFNRRDVIRYAGYTPEWQPCRLLTSTAFWTKWWLIALIVLTVPFWFVVWGLWANHLCDLSEARRDRQWIHSSY